MEIIFNQNVTREEKRRLLGNPKITNEEMLLGGLSQVQYWLNICTLYRIRKNNEKTNEYLLKAKGHGLFQFKL